MRRRAEKMNPIDKEMYLMYAETDEYQKAVRQLEENVSKAFSEYSNPYVAYSGGKDSLVMSHAVLQENIDTLIFHWDYGLISSVIIYLTAHIMINMLHL